MGELVIAGFVELTDEGYRLSSAERKAVKDRRAAMKAAAASDEAALLPDHGLGSAPGGEDLDAAGDGG